MREHLQSILKRYKHNSTYYSECVVAFYAVLHVLLYVYMDSFTNIINPFKWPYQ